MIYFQQVHSLVYFCQEVIVLFSSYLPLLFSAVDRSHFIKLVLFYHLLKINEVHLQKVLVSIDHFLSFLSLVILYLVFYSHFLNLLDSEFLKTKSSCL